MAMPSRLGGVLALTCAMSCGGIVERDLDAETGGVGALGGATGGVGGTQLSGGSGGTGGTLVTGGGGLGGAPPCPDDFSSDPEHCGYCGHSCLGGECVGGKCQSVELKYLGNEHGSALAVDDMHVYWASPVQRMAKDGDGLVKLADASPDVWGVAVDESFVYWASPFAGVWRVPKSGGAAQTLGLQGYRVAVDATHVYTVWQGVFKIAKSGGAVSVLANKGNQGIAVDDDFVYFTTWDVGGAFRVKKTGGEVSQLGKSQYSSYCAVFGERVYWTAQSTPGAVYSALKTGGDQKTLKTASTPYGIAADAEGLYFAEYDAGTIWMLPATGAAPIALAIGQFYPRDIAVDAVAVYWTNDASKSAISKVAKP